MVRPAVLSDTTTRHSAYRFEPPDRDTLERLVAGTLPGYAEDIAVELFRDVCYDTPAHDLESRGATVLLRLHQDGSALLRVDVLERRADDGSIHHVTAEQHIATADAAQVDAASIFAGAGEAARLVRALTHPTSLVPVLELETLRRVRTGEAGVHLECDVVTVRSGELSADLLEVNVGGGVAEALRQGAHQLQAQHMLRPLAAGTLTRARELFEELNVTRLERQLRAAREVAVVVHDRGALALLRRGARLTVPAAAGFGPFACRRALRRAFGSGRGRIRLLGVHGDVPGRPSVQVWLAENVEHTTGDDVVWLPIAQALDHAGVPGMRDGRALTALQVVARSSFMNWAPPPGGTALAPRGARRSEPFEQVLQRLEAGDVAFEPPASDVPPQLLLNMELSRLSFDERVLAIAEDPAVPLLERLRFLGMFGERRDDFFMSRVAHFKRLLAREPGSRSMDGLTPDQQLDAIAVRARQMTHRAWELLNRSLLPELAAHGIRIERWSTLAQDDRAHVRASIGARLEALIMPHAADPAHPFPHLRNLRPAIAAEMRGDDGTEQFLAVELPGDLPRFVPLPGGRRFVPLEDVIEAWLPELYPGMQLVRAHTFRVTRSAEMDLAGEPLDMLQLVEEEVSRRPFQEVVRLEVEHAMPPAMRHRLLREFQYELEEQPSTPGEQDVYTVGRLVDLAALRELAGIDMPELKFEPITRRDALDAGRSVFDQVRERARLFHFPHDRFETSVERFLDEAAADADVVSIRVTLYRTDRDSRIVAALREARARGKEVAVLLELKASFDEQRNIEWARELEQDGIRISFSPVRFKVHAKTALVVRREDGTLRRYAYIGTGNLNASTARSYVDLGLLTCDAVLTREVGAVFNLLTGNSGGGEIRRLVVAPFDMRRRLLQLIERETQHARDGRPARIRLQLNGLADRRLIGALYRASQAGVRVEMMVREICALRPGVPGVSDNITVVSVVGRLLQHARILHFHNAGDDEYFIGSADWRPRNLSERVEVVTPIDEPEHRALLDQILTDTLGDPTAWVLGPAGEHTRRG